MTVDEFASSSLEAHQGALRALWFARHGQWEQAHDVAQSEDDRDGAWVHAYLHRMEGDTANAGYWYRRAGRPAQHGSLETEWESMVEALLNPTHR